MKCHRKRAIFLVAIACGSWSTEAAAQRPVNALENGPPSELVSQAEHWINAPAARTLEGLRGQPVWLQFNF